MGRISTEDKTRPYSVYIVDQENMVDGSGVLFYPGGNRLFVFTCAHVVDRSENVRLVLLKPVSVERDLYQMVQIQIPKEQILYSPLDHVTEQGGEMVHSEDFAIIQVQKPQGLELEPTHYFLGETLRNNPIYTQGYPNGVPENAKPLDYLECFHGSVVVNAADEGYFTVRITDGFLDQGSRVFELKGISGAPIWDGEQEQGLLGLMSSAYGESALLAKVFATKMGRIRTLMREKYGITIERRLLEIPEEEVAGSEIKPLVFDGTIEKCETNSDSDEWIRMQTEACKCQIDGLQLQKAIDTAEKAIRDQRFDSCSTKSQKYLMQHLLYCYEIGDLDAEFEQLEEEMRRRGLIRKWDSLRRMTRSFMKREYKETIEAAEYCIQNEQENKKLLSCANTFQHLARAYEEDLPAEETIGCLIDKREHYRCQPADTDDMALLYQMIGYVYGERYHDYINSVRFLNRSYQIGSDNVILENLGAAYYFLAISDATGEDDKVDLKKVDRRALYKARECFLIVRQKADELFWAGTMRRVGVCIYNRNLLGGLYRENLVKSRNYEAVKSSKKWENVGNSYIIPALLLYRYSYI